jgi:hypothetical protein
MTLSGCGSAGRAGGLGASITLIATKKQKCEKAFIYAPFRHFAKSQKSVKIGLDHSLSHFYAKSIKIQYKIGVWLSW